MDRAVEQERFLADDGDLVAENRQRQLAARHFVDEVCGRGFVVLRGEREHLPFAPDEHELDAVHTTTRQYACCGHIGFEGDEGLGC